MPWYQVSGSRRVVTTEECSVEIEAPDAAGAIEAVTEQDHDGDVAWETWNIVDRDYPDFSAREFTPAEPAPPRTLADEVERYNAELNLRELSPNGDDYNNILEIIQLYHDGQGARADAIEPLHAGDR